ncbi:MAG: AAA family ATPase, partial [Candidatus Dormibacteraceae bacterium]
MEHSFNLWEEEIEQLACALPPHLHRALHQRIKPAELLEVVLDLGREPEARSVGQEVLLDNHPVSAADLEYVAGHVGQFGEDNRAGIERTLHRISAIRNRAHRIVGLTCRVGRAVGGTAEILRDIVEGGQSILLLGRPGIGKTTILRECARILADDHRQRVVIVDTSNEIGGDGDIPHPGIGRARRMQVSSPLLQHGVMIEAVENHMPEVIVIDEIGTELEALAARTIAERGVQLLATAHGQTVENLLVNPTLNDLLGGIQTVTLSDEEARRRGTQKSVQERKAAPTFDILIEIWDRDRMAIHQPLAAVVDAALRGHQPTPKVRVRTGEGKIISTISEELAKAPPVAIGSPLRPRAIFPYGVSHNYLEQSLRELGLSVKILGHPDGADLVLTLKNHHRRRPQSLIKAEASG